MSTTATQLLTAWVEEVGCFGASAAVRAPGRPDVFVSAGIDAREPPTAMTTDRSFWIGSVTKTFTAAAILLLVDEGRLGLDDTLDTYSTVFPDSDAITIRMLLIHTSGVPDLLDGTGDEYVELLLGDLERVFRADEAAAVSASLPPTGSPGAEVRYSNTGFLLLGSIIEQVTATPLAHVFAQRLLDPLGLKHTFLGAGRHAENLAHGWFTLDPKEPRNLDSLDFPNAAVLSLAGAAGGMISNLADLLDWTAALYGGSFSEPLRDRLFASTHPPQSPDDSHGYGVKRHALVVDGGVTVDSYGHTGNLVGSSVIIEHFPATNVSVVAHANVQEVDEDRLVELAAALSDVAP